MADWSLPTLTSIYTSTLTEIKNRDIDLALQFDGTASTSLPTGAIRWTSSAYTWQKWTGSAWGPLSSLFAFPAIQLNWNSRLISNYDNTYRQGFRFGDDRVLRIFSTTGDGTGGAIALSTRNGAGSSDADYGIERVRIDSSGRVGFGVIPTCSIDSALGGMFQHGSGSGNNFFQTYTNGGAVGMGMWAGGSPRLYSTGSMNIAVNATIGTGSPTGFLDVVNVASSGRVGLLNESPAVSLDIAATDAIRVPAGTTTQRPGGGAGMFRYNSSLGLFEGFATAWGTLAPTASPTFTGTVTIPAGASIAGFAPLASPTFTGTVTIPAGASIAGFARLASPTFTGTPAAPTPAAGASNTLLATTAFVQGELASRQRFLQVAAVATTSGTAVDFTGIPSWAKRITVMFNKIGTTGQSAILIRIGAGSILTSGYSAGSAVVTSTNQASAIGRTDGFGLYGNYAEVDASGHMVLTCIASNTWISSQVITYGAGNVNCGAGAVTLPGTLDRVRITNSGTDTFDAGSIGLLIEG